MLRKDPNFNLPMEYKPCFKDANCFGVPKKGEEGTCPDHCLLEGNCQFIVSITHDEDEDKYNYKFTGTDLDDDEYMAVGISRSRGFGEAVVLGCSAEHRPVYWFPKAMGYGEAEGEAELELE